MNRRIWLFVFCVCTPLFILAQTFQIKGKVIETVSRFPVPYANVWIAGLSVGAATDAEGAFVIDKVPPGIYKLQVSALRYKTVVTPEYKVNHLTPPLCKRGDGGRKCPTGRNQSGCTHV